MDRRIFGLETEYGVACTSGGTRRLTPDEVARYLFRRVVTWGRRSNVFLATDPGIYLDVGSHPEYATAECDDLIQLINHDRAGERILEDLIVDAEHRLASEGISGDIYLFKNNTDSHGNSYGCHENYLISPDRRLLQDHRRAGAVPGLPAVRSAAPARCCTPPAERSTASASAPSTSGRACRRRPPAAGRSSTPATSRTPIRSATGGCTSSSATPT